MIDCFVCRLTGEFKAKAYRVLVEEFPDHDGTDLDYYEWASIAIKDGEVIGIVTANKYLPKKAILCDIAVDKKYRSQGVGILLLKHIGQTLQNAGYEYLLGFTHKKNKEALNTYKRVYTKQEEMIVTTSELAVSIPHITQLENRLQYRRAKKSK